ncbi:MAG: hypothetical protein MZV63_56115 [Marinilabiliales bacterium]|nr:hypothetical protein [Marinilabiliales bacterium]
MNGYVANIVGGTGTSATNSITVTVEVREPPDPSASTTPIPDGNTHQPPHQRSRALSSMPCRWFPTSPCLPMMGNGGTGSLSPPPRYLLTSNQPHGHGR